MHRTHSLECDRFADAFPPLLETVVPHATTATVLIDPEEADHEPDGPECRAVWARARDAFERAPDADESGREAWRCDTTDPDARAALFDVGALISGIIGRHFVFGVRLQRDGTQVLDSIPHHSAASIDADALPDDTVEEVDAALVDLAACLVPHGTRIVWEAADRRWSVRGSSICVETPDGKRTACYGVSNLRGIDVADDGTTLALSWGTEEFPDDAVGRLLSWVTGKLYSPPPALPCGTEVRASEVRELLAETLEKYDGRSL